MYFVCRYKEDTYVFCKFTYRSIFVYTYIHILYLYICAYVVCRYKDTYVFCTYTYISIFVYTYILYLYICAYIFCRYIDTHMYYVQIQCHDSITCARTHAKQGANFFFPVFFFQQQKKCEFSNAPTQEMCLVYKNKGYVSLTHTTRQCVWHTCVRHTHYTTVCVAHVCAPHVIVCVI